MSHPKPIVISLLAFLSLLLFLLSCKQPHIGKRTIVLDRNNDNLPDSLIEYNGNGAIVGLQSDRNLDGRFDWRDTFVPSESASQSKLTVSEADQDFNGSFETVIHYNQDEQMTFMDVDTNEDGFMDTRTAFAPDGKIIGTTEKK